MQKYLIKYLGICLIRERTDIYDISLRHSRKKLKKVLKDGKPFHAHGAEEMIL